MTESLLLGAWLIDPARNTVCRDGTEIRVTPKMMQVLVCLACRPGETISREELLQTVWPNTFVTDDVLNGSISELRRLFEDDAHDPHIIETIPKRGYRLISPVQPVNRKSDKDLQSCAPNYSIEGKAASPLLTSTTLGRQTVASLVDTVRDYRRAKRTWMLIGAALGVLAVMLGFLALAALNVGGLGQRVPGMNRGPSIRSLAVFPLQNLSADPGQEYFSDGVTDALTTALAQISSLRVISRTSSSRYKNPSKSLPEIARDLHVDGIVEGTVQRSGNHVRISAQLIDAHADRHLWAKTYEVDLQDTFSIQSQIARSISQQIKVNLTPREEELLTPTKPVNLKAIEYYLQGRYHFQKERSLIQSSRPDGREAESQIAIEDFKRATSEDPNYAAAYVAMAQAWVEKALLSHSEDLQAREAIRKALTIDPSSGEAYIVLGRIDLLDWQWDACGNDYRRAIEFRPNLAEAHARYAEYLDVIGHIDEGLREAQLAKNLDPADERLAWAFYVRRQYDRFIELKRNDVDSHMFGPMAHFSLAIGYERAKRYPEAIHEWEESLTAFGFADQAESLRRGYAAAGFKGAIREWASALESLSARGSFVYPEELAYLYAVLGDRDRAFAWLEKAYQQRTYTMPFLGEDPTWDDIRSDPRFADLEHRVGVPWVSF